MTEPSHKPASSPAFRIRPARRGDAEAIKALLGLVGYTADAATLNWVISHPEMEVFVAADAHDKAIGLVTLSHRPQLRLQGRMATIDELVVAPPWRRRGIGRELLKRAVERARVLSAKQIELTDPHGHGEEARRFYEACGFADAGAVVFRPG